MLPAISNLTGGTDSVVAALRYFGPMNVLEIVEALSKRDEYAQVERVDESLRELLLSGKVREGNKSLASLPIFALNS